jgi:hypothetical protein
MQEYVEECLEDGADALEFLDEEEIDDAFEL